MKRSLIFAHRWLGVVLCLNFLIWFVSGVAMMYWDFPGVTPADRLERSPNLDPLTVRLSPSEAFAKTTLDQPPSQARLNIYDGRPAYRFRSGREEWLIFADTGDGRSRVTEEYMLRVAAAWTGQSSQTASVRRLDEVDQWTVQGQFASLKPLWKYSWPDGEQVYVSQTSGEVVQYTTTSSRLGAYVGAIPHWLYFTSLRKNGPLWSQVVIWLSGVGTFAAVLGLTIGVWMYSPSKRYRDVGGPTSIPYRGWKRWHMIAGLVFGAGAVTWALSGMLSMDPLPAQRDTGPGNPLGQLPSALRGRPELAAFDAKPPQEALARIAGLNVKELELTSFDGEPVYLAALAGGETRVIRNGGDPQQEFDRTRLIEIVRRAAKSDAIDVRMLDNYDRYYLDRRRELPLPVILVEVDDADRTRYYIDPRTARIVASYSLRQWIARWPYHALHSLNFPWLYEYRPLWDIVVIGFMAGGTALSVTSLMLAWGVVARRVGRG